MFRLLILAFLCLPTSSWAIYKCQSAKGIIYSDQPCPASTATMQKLPPPPAPPSDDEASNRLSEQKKQLQQLQTERAQQEAMEVREREKRAKAHAQKQDKCADLALRARWAEEDAARAPVKSIERARLHAQRQKEKHALQCTN